jgi:hypothetical protein
MTASLMSDISDAKAGLAEIIASVKALVAS